LFHEYKGTKVRILTQKALLLGEQDGAGDESAAPERMWRVHWFYQCSDVPAGVRNRAGAAIKVPS
jgi:hypothetical protein